MKTNTIIYLVIVFFMVVSGLWAQDAHRLGINIEDHSVVKQRDRISVSFNIVLEDLEVEANNMVVLTPVLKSNENSLDSIVLPSVVVAGGKRYKVLRRKEVLGTPFLPDGGTPATMARKDNSLQAIPYSTYVPYRQWMQDASLSMLYRVSGCADCTSSSAGELLVQHIVPAPYQPAYRLTYVVPQAEVGTRSDRHTATINFELDRWELLRDFRGNALQLNEVDRIVGDIRSNPDMKIVEFAIHGYASPEATVSHNRMLAQNRAKAFADYLVSKFGIDPALFTITAHGEDWDGLRKAVAASSLADRQAVLDIIDQVSNPDDRDARLMQLSGGGTYLTLLEEFYPPLRRTQYVVAYTGRAFNLEEARKNIKTNPRLLDLNEMYLVAKSYPVDSKEFREVFDIAVRMYPDDDIAILNSAATDIEGGNPDAAIARMDRIADNPKVWNNLGVAYARKGNRVKAKEYFTKAAGENNPDARHNLNELNNLDE